MVYPEAVKEASCCFYTVGNRKVWGDTKVNTKIRSGLFSGYICAEFTHLMVELLYGIIALLHLKKF